MITIDWLHLVLFFLFVAMLIWHVTSTAGSQMILHQLKSENLILRRYVEQLSQKGTHNEQSESQ